MGALLAAFLGMAFLLPLEHETGFWTGVISSLLMCGVAMLTFYHVYNRNPKRESRLLGRPLLQVAFVAVIVQHIVSLVMILLGKECPLWAAAAVEILIFAATGIGLIGKKM